MKKLLLVLVLLYTVFTYAQDIPSKVVQGNDSVPEVVEEPPIFPGCENSENKNKCLQIKMLKHVQRHFNSDLAGDCLKREKYFDKENKVEKTKCVDFLGPGKHRISAIFTIGANGIVKDIKVRSRHSVLKKEGKRIVKLLPKMKPGKLNGKPRSIKYRLPINFRIN